ncbi:MAG: permease [Dehalococcoidia bacterium]|nr:MAG: permease [Dehalococcoidia bacterium]
MRQPPTGQGGMTAYLLLAGAALTWGGGAIAVKVAVAAIPPLMLVTARYGVAATVLSLLLVWQRRPLPRRRDLPLLLAMGLTGVVGFAAPFNAGLQFTGAGEGAILTALSPFVAMLLTAWWLREPVTLRRVVAGIVALVGVALLVLAGPAATAVGPNRGLGDLLVLAAAISWGTYSVLVRFAQRRGLSLLDTTAWTVIVGALISLPVLPFEPRPLTVAALELAVVGAVLYTGICASVMAYLAWNEGVRRIGPSRASLFNNVNPVAAAIISAVLFGERLTVLQLVGAVLVLSGLVVANLQPAALARATLQWARPGYGAGSLPVAGAPEAEVPSRSSWSRSARRRS